MNIYFVYNDAGTISGGKSEGIYVAAETMNEALDRAAYHLSAEAYDYSDYEHITGESLNIVQYNPEGTDVFFEKSEDGFVWRDQEGPLMLLSVPDEIVCAGDIEEVTQ